MRLMVVMAPTLVAGNRVWPPDRCGRPEGRVTVLVLLGVDLAVALFVLDLGLGDGAAATPDLDVVGGDQVVDPGEVWQYIPFAWTGLPGLQTDVVKVVTPS